LDFELKRPAAQRGFGAVNRRGNDLAVGCRLALADTGASEADGKIRSGWNMLKDLFYRLLAKRSGITDPEMTFAFCEFKRLFKSDKTVEKLGKRAAKFLPDSAVAAPIVCDEVKKALQMRRPLSLIRVGDGEGNALSMLGRNQHPAIMKAFDIRFCYQNHLVMPREAAIAFCTELRHALLNADIKGFRITRFDERKSIENYINRSDLCAALGIVYARSFFYEALRFDHCVNSIVTNTWIYFDLIPLISRIFDSAAGVVVVSGRSELEEKFRKRLGSRLKYFISVPVEGFVPRSLEDSHYGKFAGIRNMLKRADLSGVLVLVGAGFFGKIYCSDAKAAGGVAIDLGSGFDLLAGLATRPVHCQVDLGAIRW
jgi:hypothetical protein